MTFIKDGYVLKYSDATFAGFFAEELNIDIKTEKYYAEGNSKGTGGEARLYRMLRGEELTGLINGLPTCVGLGRLEYPVSRRKFAGFSRSGVKGIDENWDDIRRFNSVLRRLEKRRATRVERVGPLAKSKIAWKAAVLQQALLYRTIELGNGCAKMWNYGNVLCSVLAARALLETIAVTLDFEVKLHEHYKTRNFQALDQLITSHTFATRDAGFLAEAPELAAKNVLTYIDRLERKMPLIRKHYESLSEWCHPNSNGHYFTFGSLNRETGSVRFSKRKLLVKGLLDHVLAVYVMVGLIENAMDRLDVMILDILNAHAEAHPVN